VIFLQEDITLEETEQTVKKGMVQVPEGRKIFATLTVLENLEMGAYTVKEQSEIDKSLERAFSLFPACLSGATSWAAPSLEGNNRCWRLRAG
jgi:branched-chain amino acid transport system ATP-binding protein